VQLLFWYVAAGLLQDCPARTRIELGMIRYGWDLPNTSGSDAYEFDVTAALFAERESKVAEVLQ